MKFLSLGVAAVLATAPAHAQWQMLDAHTTADLRGIDNVGGGVAWASGTHGTVLRTEDGGFVWQLCATPPGAAMLDFRGVQAFDANTAIVMSSGKGDLSRLYKTTDGCQTWRLVFTNPDKDGFWDAIHIFSPSRDLSGNASTFSTASGDVLGDPVDGVFPIFTTRNGGDSWSRMTQTERTKKGDGCKIDPLIAKNREAVFAASNESLVSFPGQHRIFVTGGATSRLAYTDHFDLDFALCHDAAHFINLPLQHGEDSQGAFALSATNSRYFRLRLMVVGGDYRKPSNTAGVSVFISSRDGFRLPGSSHFKLITPSAPPHGYRSAVAYDASAKIWITVGPNGTDISTDDGRNWRALRPGLGDAPDADQQWNALSLPFVVGPKGRIGVLRRDVLAKSASK